MKILFSCITQYHILNSIIYKLRYFPNEHVIIMVTHYRYKQMDINYLKSFFDDIVPYDPIVKPSFNNQVKAGHIQDVFRKHGYKIKEFTDIYVGGAQYAFGCFLVQNNIKFNMFEEAAGILSNTKQLEDIDCKINPLMCNYAKSHGLYDGNNKLIKKIVCNIQAQKYPLDNEKIEHFDCVETLGQLKKKQVDLVVAFYLHSDMLSIKENSTIIFTQSFMNLKIHTLEYQCLIYQYFVDYFYPNDNIVFKTHPDDVLYYGLLFPKARVIRQKFPAEIIPYVFKNIPHEIATIASTAIDNLRRYFSNSFALDSEYGHTVAFLSTHRVYVGLCYVAQINNSSNIFIDGYPISLFKGFIIKKFPNIKIVDSIENAEFIFIDDFTNSKDNILYRYYTMLNNKQKIIYINSQSALLEYSLFCNDIDNIKPIIITKQVIRKEHIYQDLSNEIIFVLDKSNLYNMEFNMEKKLEHTGVILKSEQLSKEQIRIKVLEGILETTEKRLVYVLEENKRLKEQLGVQKS